MGILLLMRRISPEEGARALAEDILGPECIEDFEEVGKGWGVTQVLANGVREGDLSLAAQAITRGVSLGNEPADVGGMRVISAAGVLAIREALIQIDDAEVERRHERLHLRRWRERLAKPSAGDCSGMDQ